VSNFSPLRLIVGRDSVHESLFLARYQQLLAHATRLTHGNRDLAGDLIQDLFLYFTETKPNLDEIENLDAYLYTSLKHLHFAHLRKGMRDPIGELAVVHYESAELSLRAAPQSNRFYVYDQLKRICEYALAQKNNSKSHALLLLRFFLGYYMEELVLVARSSKPTIRKYLQEAQSEVQEGLAQPTSKSVVTRAQWTGQLSIDSRSDEFLLTIRSFLLEDSGQEACPSRQELIAYYSSISTSEVSTELLGHLCGCRKCLDRVNSILGLPLLADRHPENIGEHSRKPKNGSGSGTGGGTALFNVRQARRRSDSLAHHEPRKLTIRIDGEERTAHDIASNENRFVLKLSAKEDPHVVEIVSEQDVSLLTFIVYVSEPGTPVEWRRSRELSNGRTLEATLRYGENWPSVEVEYHAPAAETSLQVVSQRIEATATAAIQNTPHWFRRFLTEVYQSVVRDMNPLLAAASMLGLASIVCFVLWMRGDPHISPGDLLRHAEARETAGESSALPGVIYQKVRISTPTRTIERALYRDAQGKRRPRPQPLDQNTAQLNAKLAIAGVNWDEPLSGGSYREWHDHRSVQNDVVKHTGKNLLTLTTTVSDGMVAQESLTVRENDFHAVERTIRFRDAETVDIAELNYDVMPWGAVNSNWFEPLSGQRLVPGRMGPVLSPLPPQPLSEDQINIAELEARIMLNQLQADTNERIEIIRHVNGVEVKGIVATSERKREIQSRLYHVPHVSASIATFQDLQDRPTSITQITSISVSSAVASQSPLVRYLLTKGRSADEAVQLSQQLMNSALVAKQHSKAMDELLHRFASGGNLSVLARSALDQLFDRHKAALLAALQDEERFIAQAGLSSNASGPSSGAESLLSAEEKNVALCVELTSGNDEPSRAAEKLLPEIATAAAQLRTVALSVPSASKSATTASSLPRPTEKER
jgi:DNA-directed RNA polymerase specialized sigma24 family protein